MVDRVRVLADGEPGRAQRLERLRQQPEPNWTVLVEHALIDGRKLSADNVRVLYTHLTDRLIHNLTSERFDHLVCLDKSARPVAWLTLALWDLLAVTFTGSGLVENPIPRPDVTFLNIDRLQWRDILDPQGIGDFNAARLDADVLEALRRCFLRNARQRDVGPDELLGAATYFTNKKCLVVDEVSVSGDTASMAVDMLRRAFPDGEFQPGHWMHPKLVTGRDGNRRNNLLPVWYRDDTMLGRGIADRNPEASMASERWRVQAGAWFLSRPHPPGERDEPGRQLRKELVAVAAGVLGGSIALVPDFDRDDADARCRWFNNGMSLVALREWREAEGIILDV